jgi:hypothetical protein
VKPSWDRKVERAERHLKDFEALIAPFQHRRGYPVSEGFETYDGERLWTCRLDIPEPEDPLLPIIAGDLMFNLRSALDHLAHAMVRRATRQTAFPLFTVDPHEQDPVTGEYLHREDRDRWLAMTKGFPKRAIPTVELVQAYHLKRHGRDPRYGALALLRAFQNADKHRRLAVIVGGFSGPIIWYQVGPAKKLRARLPRLPDDGRLKPREALHRSVDPLPPGVYMEAEGTVDVMVGDGRRREYYSCPWIFEAMIRDVAGVIDQLRDYAVHAPPPTALPE